MGKLNLIISTDYEIFGNGSGAVDTCMIAPAETLMQLTEKHGARVCFFVDVCEYWAFQAAFKSGDLAEDEALKIADQLKDAIQRGHDVQLHFHPQWLEAEFKDGQWNLNEELWRLPKVEGYKDWTILKLFERGKQTLEELLRPVKSDYRCHVFRAGAWCIQPEEEVLKAMKKLGFTIESTVAPGKKFSDGRTMYDFSHAPKKATWKINQQVTTEDEHGQLTEYPIFTAKISPAKNQKFTRLKITRKIPQKPAGCQRKTDVQYKRSKLLKALDLLKPQIKMLNHSDGVPFEEMRYITKKALQQYASSLDDVPIVMIGHPKTFGNHLEFDAYLAWVKSHPQINFSNY